MRDAPNAMGYPSIGASVAMAEASHVSRAVESAEVRAGWPLAGQVLRSIGLSAAALGDAALAAEANGTDIGRELIARKDATEEALTAAMAAALGLAFAARIPDEEARIDAPGGPPPSNIRRTLGPGLEPRIYVAPSLDDLETLARVLDRSPAARARMRLTTPSEIRRSTAMETVAERASKARLSLSADAPDLSARQVMTGTQGAVLAALAIGFALFAHTSPLLCLFVLHVVSALVFLAPSGLRLAAGLSARPGTAVIDAPMAGVRPLYSVLVALRGEEEVVRELVGALTALRWPRSRLEVFLVCEADDPGTIAAVRAAIAGEPGFEIVIVPVSHPRTKPKALNFALPLASGEFVVLYDAEDRPDPGQLEAAWRAFSAGDDRLACLQAELTIANGRESRLSGLFALEYAALFRGFLPWLARRNLPLPLGGTSNHFRRRHLLAVGGWDSHNVTEDADLGMRLSRHGYRVGTLASETLEDAPTRWRVWHAQRTRWMKGWLQTYLVHMRDPAALGRDLGLRGFAAFQILFIGMIVSAIAHPLFLVLLGWAIGLLASGHPPDAWTGALMLLDLVNVLGGVLAAVLLALATVEGPDRRRLLRELLWLYPYWLLVSFSAACAFVELYRRPHHWAKTPHVRRFIAEDEEDDRKTAENDAALLSVRRFA